MPTANAMALSGHPCVVPVFVEFLCHIPLASCHRVKWVRVIHVWQIVCRVGQWECVASMISWRGRVLKALARSKCATLVEGEWWRAKLKAR